MKSIIGMAVSVFLLVLANVAVANIKPVDCYSLSMYVMQQTEVLHAGGAPGPIASKNPEMVVVSYWIVQMVKKNIANGLNTDGDTLARNFMVFCASARGDVPLMINSMRGFIERDNKEAEPKIEKPRIDIENGPVNPGTETEI